MFRSHTYRPRVESLEDRCVPSTFTVKSLLDAGPGSLRQAVLDANSHAHIGLDSIVFKPGLKGIIKLTGGQIAITDSLTLIGPGAAKIAVDGNANGRIFEINDFDLSTFDVKIQGLKLRNGSTPGDMGGAIKSLENLSLAKLVFSNNHAAAGGAIGGGDNHLTIQQCTFAGNSANYFSAGNGGAIFFFEGPLTLVKSRISGNTANNNGGGLYQSGGTATISNSVITGNYATEGSGGGVYAKSTVTNLTIANSTITGNHATGGHGGGVFTAAGVASISGTRIASNDAKSLGGGVASNGSTTIDRSTVIGNRSTTSFGGGIAQVSGSLALRSSTVRGNHADAGNGGGVLLADSGALMTVTSSTLSGNSANKGGGLFIQNCTAAILVNSTISGNKAATSGGGIYGDGSSTFRAQNCTVAFNQAIGVGGGIASLAPLGGTMPTLQSTLIANNSGSAGSRDVWGPGFFAEFCLIRDPAGAVLVETTADSNRLGVNPRLAPLANNGGPTKTHALLAGSPAINKGSSSALLTTDQRGPGHKRKLGLAVDIGAFERQ